MNKIHSCLWLCVACLFTTLTASAADSLESGFTNPPPSAKARTWWHWVNGNISKEGITADLEAMKRVGIQEAQIFNVDQGYPEGPASFLTPEWLELFHFAVLEAKRLGLEIGFHNGAGWSSSGGPWVTPEYAMQRVVFSEVRHTGGTQFQATLPQPATKLNYYQDIAVLAFPTPKDGTRIDNLDAKSLSNAFENHLQPDAKHIPEAAMVLKSDIVILTGKMDTNGMLKWDAPAGEWTILRIGHTPHGTQNHPAGIGGLGLECDKLSRAAVDAYWAGGIEPILKKLGSLAGSTLTNCVIDSYEVGCNNWTSGFDKAFAQRRGYDCLRFLPTLAGYYVESGEVSERFLWDFRRTLGDLMAENYYGYFSELCHKHGMKFSVEPYGGPFESLQAGSTGDIVMSEFWLGARILAGTPKLASSIAHLNGNPLVGAESFTSMGGWRSHPAMLKQSGDWAWSEGVNRLIFHTYVQQPWDFAPGVTFHMYGIEMSRLNTWWEQGRAYMSYLARSQFLLQQGRFAADVLVFAGESSPNDGIPRTDIKALGYDYDEIGTNKMASLTVKDGWICTPVGGSYRLLVLPETTWMSPGLTRKIGELAEAGATIIGPKPVKSPSLQDFPECDDQVAELANKIWDNQSAKERVIANSSVKTVLTDLGLTPDFSAGTDGSDLLFLHRIAGDADIYFVANPKNESRDEKCRFRVAGKQPELWNPETGEITDAVVWQSNADGSITVPIAFDPEGSVFVVFRKAISPSADHIVQAKTALVPLEAKPLSDLKIIKAEYGVFLPEGTVDVTAALSARMKDGTLHTAADNSLPSFDPAMGIPKELRLEYETGGKRRQLSVQENRQFSIPEANETGELRLIRAIYGKFPQGSEGLPPKPSNSDVTAQVAAIIASNTFLIPVDNRFGESSSDKNQNKELRLIYSAEGEIRHMAVAQGHEVNLTLNVPKPKLLIENGKATWLTPQAGSITCITASGLTKTAEVKSIPKPIEMKGAWDVSFPPDFGAPANARFDKLISWPESSDQGIRYFSGTAVYRKQFTVPEDCIGTGRSLELDLGSVRVIAEVIVNGKNLGILWKAPFRINLDDSVRAGENELEVRVTNLWPNRLIGDAALPEDCEWGDWVPKRWPDWLEDKTKRPGERITFTTWKHWNADSQLQPSGLLGPVFLRPYVHLPL